MKRNKMTVKKIIITLLAFLLAAGNVDTVSAQTIAPKKIALNKTSLTVYVDSTKNLYVKSVTPKKADKEVTWKSSNNKIATVTEDGQVKGIKQGKATITATSKKNGKKAKCVVTVKKRKKLPAEIVTPSTGEQETMPDKSLTEKPKEDIFYIKVGANVLSATFENNSSADAFRELLRECDVTVSMSDYGNFEKVGSLGTTLPRNDTQITTVPGDVILYQGSSITIYYDTNSWNFTRLGKIEGATTKSMKEFLGDGNVDVVFSLNK